MKLIYSHILLIALMTGTLQPALPMLEFSVFKGSLIELLAERSESACSGMYCDLVTEECPCDTSESQSESLLDVDYYPVPLNIQDNPLPDAFSRQLDRCYQGDEQTVVLHYKTDLPPPRVA